MKTLNELEAFECICHSPEHTLHIEYASDTNNLIFSINLNQCRNVFKRIWVAIKYIFGYKCKYGQWDVFELDNSDVPRFKEILNTLNEIYDKQKYPNYCTLNGEYVFFNSKQDLIDKIKASSNL